MLDCRGARVKADFEAETFAAMDCCCCRGMSTADWMSRLAGASPSELFMIWEPSGGASRLETRVLSDVFSLAALAEAVKVAGRVPESFSREQACQSTIRQGIGALEGLGARIRMDGKGPEMDKVVLERLRRSLKCEELCLRGFRCMAELDA